MEFTLKTVTVKVSESGATAGCPEEAEAILRSIFSDLDSDREHFVLLSMDSKNKVRGFKVVATGGETSAIVDTRIVFRDALALGAVGIVVAHNHPSGDTAPSPEDRALTSRLNAAGDIIGISLRDHLVLGDGRAFSFRREGLL